MRKLIEKIGIWSAGWCVAARRPRLNLQPSTLNPQHGFTLIEVNLAIFIMAGGVLAMISLYSLGFRESRQSLEDVASAALAETVLNPLVVALSDRQLKWSEWRSLEFKEVSSGISAGDGSSARIQVLPNDGSERQGWLAYIDTQTHGNKKTYYVPKDPSGSANDVYRKLIGADKSNRGLPNAPNLPAGMTYALVASRESANSPIITLGVRCVRKNLRNTLMAQPVISTEVHFQGDPNN